MEKIFKYLGRKAGTVYKRGRWYYKTLLGTDEEGIRAEYAMGKELAAKMKQELHLIEQPEAVKLINAIGNRLVGQIKNNRRRFEFNIIATKDMNAFALPGGFIFISAALMEQAEMNEDELAFVLAHEIIHVLFKHPVKRIFAGYSTEIISNVLIRGGTWGILAKQVLGDLLRKSYSRANELEADEYAVKLMRKAGFNPEGGKTNLERVRQTAPESLPVYNYFVTHPPTEERVQAIEKIIRQPTQFKG